MDESRKLAKLKIDGKRMDANLERAHVSWKSIELVRILDSMYYSNEKTKELVWKLEGKEELKEKLSGILEPFDFYKKYTVFLLSTYIDSDDERELMLAMFGLLHGFDPQESNVEDQRIKYWKKVYNPLFGNWKKESSAKRNILAIESDIYKKLLKNIFDGLIKNNGTLGLLSKIPEDIEIPAPRNLRPESAMKKPIEEISNEEVNKGVKEKVNKKYERKILRSNQAILLLCGLLVGLISGFLTVVYATQLARQNSLYFYSNSEISGNKASFADLDINVDNSQTNNYYINCSDAEQLDLDFLDK